MQPATIVAGCLLSVLSVFFAGDDLIAGEVAGERWQPDNPETVIVTLPGVDDSSASLANLRQQLAEDPRDATLAAHYATVALKRYAINGDPRYLGYADGALAPWRETATPPLDIWLLRGRLLQTQHRFTDAAQDLEQLLQRHSGQPEALALAADARRRGGDIDAARSHCFGLQLAGRAALARLCAADLLLTLGEFEESHELAVAVTASTESPLPADTHAWALAIAGDAAFAMKQYPEAERAYADALDVVATPPLALRLSHVDLLLATDRYDEAWHSLQELPAADAVLLRRAIVARRLDSEAFPELRETLEARLGAEDAVGGEPREELHWREKAMYALDVRGDVEAALRFAERNWQVQKGWEDAALLMRVARAANAPDALQQVTEWRAAQGASS